MSVWKDGFGGLVEKVLIVYSAGFMDVSICQSSLTCALKY